MKPFLWSEPRTLPEVTAFLAEHADAYAVMAGGTDLLGAIKDGLVQPEGVIDLKPIPGLAYIRSQGDRLHIGALTRLAELERDPTIRRRLPVLHEAVRSIATPQLREMGTVGGNLCQRPRCWYFRDPLVHCRKKGGARCYAYRGRNRYHAIIGGGPCYIVHPSDLAPALIALDAQAVLVGPEGERTVPLEDFFILPRVDVRRENILKPGEILREVHLPMPAPAARGTYRKLKERGAWDFSVVSVAVQAVVDGETFRDVRMVLGGVAPVPWRIRSAEDRLRGQPITEAAVREAVRTALSQARPLAENRYKLDLVEALAYRAALALVA